MMLIGKTSNFIQDNQKIDTETEKISKNEESNEQTISESSEITSLETVVDDRQKNRVGMADDEIVAVLGHELGHWREFHSVWLIISTEVDHFWSILALKLSSQYISS